MTRVASRYQAQAHAASIDADTLFEFVPKITPTFGAPRHLAPIADGLERALRAARGEGPPVFMCSSIPPQHGKTETYLHGLAYHLRRQPGDLLAYLTYNQYQADTKSAKVRDYARLADVDIRDDTHSKREWRTTAGGGLIAGGLVGGSVTGKEALKVVVIDDPFKARKDAESRVQRDHAWEALRDTVWTRLHAGTSVFINHTRWHPDDVIGRVQRDSELRELFEFVNFPAVTGCDPLEGDDFDVLWPEVMTKDLIRRKRAGSSDYAWWSLYMGEPRPRDTQIFQGVTQYESLPPTLRKAIGVDFAYTAKTSSDWSVAVVAGECDGKIYILDVIRRQVASTEFARDLIALQARHPGAPMFAFIGGTERGTIDFMSERGVRIRGDAATGDKYMRAQLASALWKAGNILLPSEAPWLDQFLGCLLDFTGVNDPHDDDVDALAAAVHLLRHDGRAAYVPTQRPSTDDDPVPTRHRGRGFSRRGNPWK